MTTTRTAKGAVPPSVTTVGSMVREDIERQQAERNKALKSYRQVLARNDSPKDGDAEALRELLPVLGKGIGDMEDDLVIVRRAGECSKPAKGKAKAVAAAQEVRSRLDCHMEKVNKLREIGQALRNDLSEKQASAATFDNAESDLKGLWRDYPELFEDVTGRPAAPKATEPDMD